MSTDVLEPLILDLLEWLQSGRRSYADVMDVWRTSCPRLPIWEDACDRGLVVSGRIVKLSDSGHALLAEKGRSRD